MIRPALSLLILLLLALPANARPENWYLRDGKFFVDGQWVFLKIAKPLRNFADPQQVQTLIDDLDTLQSKHFNCIEINCYWHHFDKDGDGKPDVYTQPLRNLVDAIYARGMYPCLSVETYGVGGGQIPAGFWKKSSDAAAIDSAGKPASDDEYGTQNPVPSIFSERYLAASRNFIRNITRAVDFRKILYFETTVEPQYMGNRALDFSPHAKADYQRWLRTNLIEGPAFPESFPVAEDFLADPIWNRFRAQALADWVNGDAAAFRSVAGGEAYIAVDYLETCGPDMRNRNGDSATFLARLDSVDIVQVNWHWNNSTRSPNDCAYRNVRATVQRDGRIWAVTEHMTLNGTDYAPDVVEPLLRNTIQNSTRFGWEFTNVAPGGGDFSLYDERWNPKPAMQIVDDHWDDWLSAILAAEPPTTRPTPAATAPR